MILINAPKKLREKTEFHLPEIRPRISRKKRKKVIELKLLSFTDCETSKETKIHKSTVSRIILRYESRGTVERGKNPGRPKKNY